MYNFNIAAVVSYLFNIQFLFTFSTRKNFIYSTMIYHVNTIVVWLTMASKLRL